MDQMLTKIHAVGIILITLVFYGALVIEAAELRKQVKDLRVMYLDRGKEVISLSNTLSNLKDLPPTVNGDKYEKVRISYTSDNTKEPLFIETTKEEVKVFVGDFPVCSHWFGDIRFYQKESNNVD